MREYLLVFLVALSVTYLLTVVAREIALRTGAVAAVRDRDVSRVERFGKEIAPLVTAGPPGVTGFAGGRPKAQEVVAYWPALVDRREVEPRLDVTVEAI